MKKQLTLLLALVALSFTSNAQISFDADTLVNQNAFSGDFDYSGKSYLSNNTTDASDTVFIWHVVNVNKPSEWELTVCNGDLCISSPSGDYTFNLGMGEQEQFKLGFSFFDMHGDGLVTIEVRSAKDGLIKDSLTLDLHARTANVDLPSQSKFRAYPNPASDFVTIELENGGTEVVKVYDILGNLQISSKINSGDQLNIESLTKGIYILRIEGNQNFSSVLHKQ
ncbi:MAG: hypothetical protein COA58_16500 [Bacteroidetes bacterium]|nr:MAG: hypothetical protein COA58_16500 [Bacteroidota bacterium]